MTGTVLKASVVRVRPASSVKIEGTVDGHRTWRKAHSRFSRKRSGSTVHPVQGRRGDERTFRLAKLKPNDNIEVVGSMTETM